MFYCHIHLTSFFFPRAINEKSEKRKSSETNGMLEHPADKKLKPLNELEKNIGEVKNGIVSFDHDKSPTKSHQKKTAYHSSSEDEDGGGVGGGGEAADEGRKVNQSHSNKKQNDTKSTEHKEKLRQRFLEKQKLTETDHGASQKSKTIRNQKGKFYEGSSDEEEEIIPEDNETKSSVEVLKKFQSFSNIWQDSDDENKSDEDDEEESSSDSSSSDSEDDDDVAEKAEEKKKELRRKLQQSVEVSDSKISKQNNGAMITRYDPMMEDQDQFMRKDDAVVEDNNVEESHNKTSKNFEIKTDLKEAFGKNNSAGGFSFGFLGGKNEDNEESTDTHPSEKYEIDSDEDDLKQPNLKTKAKLDIGARFGMQLKGKGVAKSSKSFFFSADDSRLEDGVKFFFDHKVNIDEVREKYNEQRPILSEILKKRLRNKQKRMEVSKKSSNKSTPWKSKSNGKVKRRSNKNKK